MSLVNYVSYIETTCQKVKIQRKSHGSKVQNWKKVILEPRGDLPYDGPLWLLLKYHSQLRAGTKGEMERTGISNLGSSDLCGIFNGTMVI